MMLTKRNRGVVLIYAIVAMIAFIAFVSFGVDVARSQKAKTELQTACDAAARNAASKLYSSSYSSTIQSNVRTAAKNTAAANYVDGTAVSLSNSDIEIGTWNTTSKTFSALSSSFTSANAVRITASCTAAKGNAVPLLFGAVYGRRTCDVIAKATVMQVAAVDLDQNVKSTGNPFLAGMPSGSVASLNNPHNNPDYAGNSSDSKQSPDEADMTIVPGASLTFSAISGSAGNDPSGSNYNPDGDTSNTGHNTNGSENGISDITAPINSLVGVFLDDTQPNLTSAPTSLDFSTSSSRDFTTLQPKLKQLFFIGDGKNSSNVQQNFVVPAGATRLFLVNWDYYEWNNNYGYRNVQVSQPKTIVTQQ